MIAMAAVATSCANSPAATGHAGTMIGPTALGVNVSSWDSTYTGAGVTTINDQLRSADLRLLRYPGGSWADEYNWITNADSSRCTGEANSACSTPDSIGFELYSMQARAAGASTFVTVNYGSGTPTEAAQWVAHAKSAKGDAVNLWEVGNESYSCYETNYHLGGSPTFVRGYTPGGAVCPSTTVMARSYAANSVAYLKAMKHASPAARIGVPWAFSGTEAAGAGVTDAMSWNRTVLQAVHSQVSFVDAHWYPFDTVKGVTDQQVLHSIRRIPAAARSIRSTLDRFAPKAAFVVGETNISERPTTLDFEPVSALFAAATSLEWLVVGAGTVDWWDLNNFGTPTTGDFGLVSSGPPEIQPAGAPLPPYYGEKLASMLTLPGSHLQTTTTRSSSLIGFTSDLGSERRVLLINSDDSRKAMIAPTWFRRGTDIRIATYSASSATTPSPITQTTVRSGQPVSAPAQSIMVLSGSPR
jgi:hypothetical protein